MSFLCAFLVPLTLTQLIERMGFAISTRRPDQRLFNAEEQANLRRLLSGVWRLDEDDDPKPYADHFSDLISCKEPEDLFDKQYLDQPTFDQTIELVRLIKGRDIDTIKTIKDEICASAPSWIPDVSSDEAISRALEFAVKLSLFTQPTLNDNSITLKDCVANSLASVRQAVPASGFLSEDFNVTNLYRIGGITIVRTGNLQDHLTFTSKKTLLIFGHASSLKPLRRFGTPSKSLLPEDFLDETATTLQLLLRPSEIESGRHNRWLAHKARVDLEIGIGPEVPLDLDRYPIFGHRLAEIQKRYNAAVPESVSQWWYDDRQKRDWATFWVAVTVFVLTVIFGLISTAIGVMQVYAAFRALPTNSSLPASGG